MRISERLLTVLAICLLVSAVPAFAKGQGEKDLKEAQALVEAKQYAQAMTLIVQMMKDYPDLREQTDTLVARIMEVRRQFNEKYSELVAILKLPSSEENTAKGLAIVNELMALDPYPDPAVKRALDIALQSIINAKVSEQFNAVMNAAATQLAAGKFAEAVTMYRDGFAVGRELFDQAATRHSSATTCSPSSPTSTGSRGKRLRPSPTCWPCRPPSRPCSRRPSQPPAGRILRNRSRRWRRQRIARTGSARSPRALPSCNPKSKMSQGEAGMQDFWLILIEQYTIGRAGLEPEGLVFAIRQPWLTSARKLSNIAVSATESAFSEMEGAFADAARLAAFRPLAEEARNRARLAIAVLEAESPAYQLAGLAPSAEDGARAAELPGIMARLRQHIADADAWETFTAARDSATAATADLERNLQAIQPALADAAGLRSGRSAAASIRESAAAGAEAWSTRLTSAAHGVGAGIADDRDSRRVRRDRLAGARARRIPGARSRRPRSIGIRDPARRGESAQGAGGQPRGRQGRRAGAGGKWPDLGNDQYVRALGEIESLLSDIDAWSARWTAEPPYVSGSAAMRVEVDAQTTLRSNVVALQTAIAAGAAAARAAVALATQLRGQGEAAFQAGQNEEKAKKYTAALASYATARDSYTASLVQQENAAARGRLAELSAISERVTTRAREQTLAEVQKLIDQGVQQFTDTDFETAIATLEAARSLWEAAAGGANLTIETFLDRATAALKVTGKQQITRTDPIYEDIRGFMTQAELSYNKAASLQKSAAGSQDYQSAISSSRSSVQAITAVVPEYREARLLALKIDRLELGMEKFAAELRKRVDAALASAKNSRAGEIVLRDAYYSLKDYKALEGVEKILTAAKRREIDASIINLEVVLGIRTKPIPAEDIRESRTLYQQALAEYRRNVNDRVLWESALLLLQRSLALNPLNADAGKLRDQVVVKRGTLVDVLSTTELASYRNAIQDFTNRNYATSEARVDELLKAKPRNPLLLDLKRQIQATR